MSNKTWTMSVDLLPSTTNAYNIGSAEKKWTVNGYTLGAACAKGVTDNSSSTDVTSTDTNLITGRTLYNAGYTKTAPSSCLNLTLVATSWSNATPPTQTVTAAGVTGSNNIIVGLGDATAAQKEAAIKGDIVCSAQSANSITLTANGTKPTVNIPITVIVLG